MSRPFGPIALWGLYLALLTTLAALWSLDWLSLTLLGAALLVPATVVLALVVADRRRRAAAAGGEDVEPVPDVSAGTPVAAVAIACLVVGAQAGLWLILIGAGLLVVAVWLLAGELRQARALRRAAEARR
jgi:hypothetical protein